MEPKNPFIAEEAKEEVKTEAKQEQVADMQAILDRLDKLEKENAELKK